MKINCISCGHSLELDKAYSDYKGMIKCYVCGTMLRIETHEGMLRSLDFAWLTDAPVVEEVTDAPVVEEVDEKNFMPG